MFITIQVSPGIGINEASFMIRVKDQTKLDYEKVRMIKMVLVAREVVEDGRETRVPVTVNIRDINDNRPEFDTNKYEVCIVGL